MTIGGSRAPLWSGSSPAWTQAVAIASARRRRCSRYATVVSITSASVVRESPTVEGHEKAAADHEDDSADGERLQRVAEDQRAEEGAEDDVQVPDAGGARGGLELIRPGHRELSEPGADPGRD